MTWQIINVEPAGGICDQCKKHDCGIVHGKHVWVRTGIYDRYDDPVIIGYGCVKAWAENLGISKEVLTKVETRPPTEQEVGSWIMNHMMNGQAIPVSEVSNDDRVVLGNDGTNLPHDVVDDGQQIHQGTPKPKGNRKRANNANKAAVR